jgi:hypothetical protein
LELSRFDLDSAQRAAREGRTEEWVQSYLRSGDGINLGLADGLLLAPRWWLGPFQIPLDSLSRKCGPEPEMEYFIPADLWNAKVDRILGSISAPEDLPPLIAERRAQGWYLADGNHRHEALHRRGCKLCWVFGWLNSEEESRRAGASI